MLALRSTAHLGQDDVSESGCDDSVVVVVVTIVSPAFNHCIQTLRPWL